MSAFVVNDATINRVVSYIAHDREGGYLRRLILGKLGYDLESPNGADELARAMFKLNCEAVDQRYGQNQAQEFRALNFKYKREFSSLPQVYMSLKCWNYQCSEGDVPETSELYKVMEDVCNAMAHRLARQVPGVAAADWD